MAIGDAVAQIMGAAQTDYQPSSGVEVKLTAISKSSVVDGFNHYDGSSSLTMIFGAIRTGMDMVDATQSADGFFNAGVMITNGVYIRKTGTTDTVVVMGVQTNA